MKIDFETGTFYLGDCFDVMATLPAGGVDMVLNDPPYGTTQNKWDAVIPFEPMWAAYWRLCSGACVLTGAMPFSAAVVMSQPKNFRHALVFEKTQATGHLNANRAPLRKHEDVLVFSEKGFTFNPQKEPKPKKDQRPTIRGSQTTSYGSFNPLAVRTDAVDVKFPTSVLRFNTSPTGGDKGLHPTQKPVALFEYLIRTYTNPGELVLDNTAGSGTTAIAAIQSGRRWICIERDPTYFAAAIARVYDAEAGLTAALQQPMT